MNAKKKKKIKTKGVAKLVKSFLKRKAKAAKAAAKTVAPKKKPVLKAVAPKKAEQKAKPKTGIRRQVPVTKKAAPAKKNAPIAGISGMKKNHGNGMQASRSFDQAPHTPSPKYFFKSDIPEGYNETYMRALPRDPEWLFAYWEISEATRNDCKAKMGEAAYASSKKILRVLDVTDLAYDGSNAQSYTDIEINEFANNWYIRVPDSGKAYVIEYGFLTSDGRFHLAVRSNTVSIPRFGISPVKDGEWTSENTDELLRLSGEALKRGLGASENRPAGAHGAFGLAAGSGSGGLSSGKF